MSEETAEIISRCLVYCRLRPTKDKELSETGTFPLLTFTGTDVNVHEEKSYHFDGSFGSDARQVDIFEKIGKPSVDHALKGFCSSLLAYGQTGSGKTHTLVGKFLGESAPVQAGIIPRCGEYLFNQIREIGERNHVEYKIEAQFVQIYRDHLGDLMSESGNSRVDIHYDAPTGVTFPGCTIHPLHNKDEFMQLFESGFKNRVTAATAMNPESSRGHAALVVWISSQSTAEGNIEQRKGKITFIDLAGYERFSKTGISSSDPVRKDEAKTINASLLSLGHVVTALSNGDKHIPWRNSKLTRMLQDSIGGRSRTTMILTVGPSSEHLFETTNTLQFGQRAMAVKSQAKMKVIVDWEKHAHKLERIIEEKNRRIEELAQQLAGCVAAESELILRQQRDIDVLREKHAEEVIKLQEEGANDDRLMTLRMQQNVEAELLYAQQAEERAYQEENLEKEENGEGSDHDQEAVSAQELQEAASASAAAAAASPEKQQQSSSSAVGTTQQQSGNMELKNNSFSPTKSSGGADERDENGKTKDEVIHELKRQVRLYRMKLLVPEKYRGASEEIEHEVLSSTQRQRGDSIHQQNNNSSAAGFDKENWVSREEHETVRKTLENEIDNRDQMLARQWDLRSFADVAAPIVVSTTVASATSNNNSEDLKKQQAAVAAAISSASSSDKEKQVATYIASLQRRIQDLSERNSQIQHSSTSTKHQDPTTNTVIQTEQVVIEKSTGISVEDATKAIQDSQNQILSSLQTLLLDAKQQFSEASVAFTSSLLKQNSELTHGFAKETQFLQTELDTAKMEMEMALEGQNESLMQAIENAREEAGRKYKIEKLSWEEDTEDRINTAVQEAVKREKEHSEDSILMLQGENAKLKKEQGERDREIQTLKIALVEAEEEVEELKHQVVTAQQQQATTTPSSTTPAAAEIKKVDAVTSPTAAPANANNTTSPSHSKASLHQHNSNSTTPAISIASPEEEARQKEQQRLNQKMLDDIDSLLMPVLKNKTQLLDDITEVLVAATETAEQQQFDDTFDNMPEIPLVSARVGTMTNTNFHTGGAGGIDPHASLANFVQLVQAQKQMQMIQRSARGPNPFLANHGNNINLEDSYAGHQSDALVTPEQQEAAAANAARGAPAGIPKLSLGGLGKAAPPIFSPGPSVSVRNLNQQQQYAGGLFSARTNVNFAAGSSNVGGGGSSNAALPPNLPAIMMRIIKRLRESCSDAETKWMKCIVTLSKISKSLSGLVSTAAAAAQQQQPKSTSSGTGLFGGNKGTTSTSSSGATSSSTAVASTQEIAKAIATVMKLIESALSPVKESEAGGASTSRSTKSTAGKSKNEAEQARQNLLNSSTGNASTLMQSVAAGDTNMSETQALQTIINSQREELSRTDEEVVSLAIEVARAKLQLRFEKHLLMALGEENDDDLKANVAELDEIADAQRAEYEDKQEAAAGKENNAKNLAATTRLRKDLKNELSFYRMKSVMLEQELRHKLAELAKTNQGGNTLVAQAPNFSSATRTTKQIELEQIQKEIHQASASIVEDMNLITSCREAELRVLSARLEANERELSVTKKKLAQVEAGEQLNSSTSSVGSKPTGVASSAESVFYHILRNLRKENSILHSVIRERGLELRKYALTLMRHQLLPPSTDVAKLAGDVHSELRLAFAERDEEIFLKEQALNMRSTQVIVLEESLVALIEQLRRNDITPCRANSKFAAELEKTKDEIQTKLQHKSSGREELKTKIERIKTELEKIDAKMASHRNEFGPETSRNAGGPVNTTSQAAQSAANDALLVLRLQKDHLSHTKNISEVQLGALESEISILKQSLLSATSTVAIESAIENRDAEEKTSFMSKLFSRGK